MMDNQYMMHMDPDDLNQRFSSQMIRYDGDIVIVDKIYLRADTRKAIIFARYDEDREGFKNNEDAIFDYHLINVERPEARWYLHKSHRKMQYPFYLDYFFRRQWKRGLSIGNCSIFSPLRFKDNYMCLFHTAISSNLVPRRSPKLASEVFEEMKTQEFSLLSKRLLVARDQVAMMPNGGSYLFFGNEAIGGYYSGKFRLNYKKFADELLECVPDADISFVDGPFLIKKPPRKPKRANQNLGQIQGHDWAVLPGDGHGEEEEEEEEFVPRPVQFAPIPPNAAALAFGEQLRRALGGIPGNLELRENPDEEA